MNTYPTKKLGDCLALFDRGISWSQRDEGGDVAVLRIPNIEEGRINLDDLKYINPKNGNGELNENDIVMVASNGNPDLVGRSALVTEKENGMRFASFLVRLRLDDLKLLPRYAHLFLLTPTFKREIRRQIATTSGIYNLRKGHIEKIKIPVPSLAVQKQIVERLDKIAEAQKLNDGLIKKSDELFQSLLHKELNPAGKNWEVKKLGDIIKPQYGYTTSAKDSGNYRFIRITDIGDDGELRDSDKKYVTLNQNEAEGYQLRNGDLLLARTGATFGKILHFEEIESAIFASFLIRLNPDVSINPFYIWLFSRSQNYWRQAKTLMTGSGQPQFNANKLKQIKIPVPPIKQQKQIVAKLSAVQDYKKQLFLQKTKLKELFDSALAKSMKN